MGSMTDVGIGMTPYYNPLTIYRPPVQHQQSATTSTEAQQQLVQQAHHQAQAQHAAMQQQAMAAAATGNDIASAQQYWYGYSHRHTAHATLHHHQTTAGPQQYLERPSDVIPWPHHSAYSHIPYQHQHAAYQQHHHHQHPQLSGTVSEWSGDENSGHHHHHHHHHNHRVIDGGDTSPLRTVSGSEISSPATPSTPTSNNNNNNNTVINNNSSSNNDNNNVDHHDEESMTSTKVAPVCSPFEWMNKPSYQSQSNPGKTRTKDKYRVVYTDHQRLELEKEFHFSRYITIRRKSELAANLALSERQVKIWFQNRRAKERKLSKKREELEQKDIKPVIDMEGPGGMASLGPLGGMSSMLGGLMHNAASPPLSLGPPPHGHPGYSSPALHAHGHQHGHPHPVLGL